MLAMAALATCLPCHTAIVESYSKTGMARSFFALTSDTVVEDFRRNNSFEHAVSGSRFLMVERGGRFYQRRQHRTAGVEEKEIHYVLGSGNHARSYVHRTPQGRLLALPVSWYASASGGFWQMAPGFDRPDHPHFRRRITYDCFFCHNGYPRLMERSTMTDPQYAEPLPQGIDCSRCHGASQNHLRRPEPGNILNPARLPPNRQLEVCLQCHLETTSQPLPFALRRTGRHFFSYQPEEPLGDYMVHFDHEDSPPWNEKFEVVSAPYRLMQSACFTQSRGQMTCTTCHNPHERPTSADSACRKCHPGAHASQPEVRQNCAGCHMARRHPEDAPLTTFTDHRISRRPDRGPGPVLPEYRGQTLIFWPKSLKVEESDLEREDELGRLRAEARRRFPDPGAVEAGLARYPHDPFLLTLGAELERQAGHTGKARAMLVKAIAEDADQPEPYINLGALEAMEGRLHEAITLFRKAWAIDPLSEPARLNLERALRARQ
jgi:hypothetical protein